MDGHGDGGTMGVGGDARRGEGAHPADIGNCPVPAGSTENGILKGLEEGLTGRNPAQIPDAIKIWFAKSPDETQTNLAMLRLGLRLGNPAALQAAGDTLENCVTEPGDVGALLTERKRPDGRINPLFQTVTYRQLADGEAPRRQRKACCLSYRVEWVGRCEHCPLPD